MKLKKSFFITFVVTYLIVGYLGAMMVGIKWDESASMLTKFLTRSEMAIKDGWMIKIAVSLVCAVIANLVHGKKSRLNLQGD